MKKFFKILIIILIVLATACLTIFLFFKNYKKPEDVSASLLGYLDSQSKVNFDEDLKSINETLKQVGDLRLEVILKTSTNLDDCLETLTTYYVSNKAEFDDEKIIKQIKSVQSLKHLCGLMMDEYEIKTTSQYFNKKIGANDLYQTMSNYIVSYSNLVRLINDEIDNLNKNSDVKFTMIEIYTDIAISTFSALDKQYGSLSIIKDSSNINEINKIFKMEHSQILLPSNKTFIKQTNNFIESYKECDKESFAKSFAANLSVVTIQQDDLTANQIATYNSEQIATFWLEFIYGV